MVREMRKDVTEKKIILRVKSDIGDGRKRESEAGGRVWRDGKNRKNI